MSCLFFYFFLIFPFYFQTLEIPLCFSFFFSFLFFSFLFSSFFFFSLFAGTDRQAQMVLAVLLVCISLEIAGDPYKLVDDSFRILGRLEITSLFVQWSTMWGGSMIFASQDKKSQGFVMFLSIIIAVANITLLAWSFMLFAAAYKSESDAERARELAVELAANGGVVRKRDTFVDIVKDKRRWVQSRLTSKKTIQKNLRSRTVSSKDVRNQTNVNPLDGIEMATMNNQGSDDDGNGNEDQGEGAAASRVEEENQMSPGMQPPPPAPIRRNEELESNSYDMFANAKKKKNEMVYQNPMEKNK